MGVRVELAEPGHQLVCTDRDGVHWCWTVVAWKISTSPFVVEPMIAEHGKVVPWIDSEAAKQAGALPHLRHNGAALVQRDAKAEQVETRRLRKALDEALGYLSSFCNGGKPIEGACRFIESAELQA